VYCKTEFQSVVSRTSCPFTNTEIGCISAVISKADSLIQESGEARTAQKAFTLLEQSIDQLKAAALPGHLSRDRSKEISSPSHDTGVEDSSDFTFTYEEEVDPEIFFIPYLWEVVVCVVAAGSIDWDANRIQVFPLLETEPESTADGNGMMMLKTAVPDYGMGNEYAKDVSDVV